jgi:hypothetical protein
MHPAALPLELLLREVDLRTSRGAGPGGQHRNKSDTMVRATHRPTGIHAQAGERRSLEINRAEALRRLRVRLALEHRRPVAPRLAPPGIHQPSDLWRSRVRDRRLVVNPRHEDFPTLLAEALDVLEWLADDVPKTARALGITPSQLIRFLALEPAALAALNHRRRSAGRPVLQ